MTKKVSQVSQGENGNIDSFSPTSTIDSVSKNQLYVYDFVINNYTQEQVSQLKSFLPSICKKALFGLEVGESGTPHIQGYINLKKKERMTALVKMSGFKGASFRPARNEEALIKYCQKDNCEFTLGFPKPIKIIQELRPWQKTIEDICLGEPDDRTIFWFWESNGGIGKSAFIKYMIVKYKSLLCQGGKHSDIINLVFNTNMDEATTMFFDIPRAHKGHISYSAMECIKNGMVCNTKYETGVKVFNPPHIIVFANFPPENPENLSYDRWNITELSI